MLILAFIQRLLERACLLSALTVSLSPQILAMWNLCWGRYKQVTIEVLVSGHLLNVK